MTTGHIFEPFEDHLDVRLGSAILTCVFTLHKHTDNMPDCEIKVQRHFQEQLVIQIRVKICNDWVEPIWFKTHFKIVRANVPSSLRQLIDPITGKLKPTEQNPGQVFNARCGRACTP